MVTCAVVNCPSRTNKDRADHKKGVRFFNIPKVITNQCSVTRSRTERRRALWLSRINRKDLVDKDIKPYTRVCSVHFLSGNSSSLWDETNPDWAPSINLGYSSSSSSSAVERYERATQRAARGSSSPNSSLEMVCEVAVKEEPEDATMENYIPSSQKNEDHVKEEVQSESGDHVKEERQSESGDQDLVLNPGHASLPDSLPVNIAHSVPLHADYEALKQKYGDLEKDYSIVCNSARRLRDQVTNLEVDKLELQTSLNSAEAAAQCMKQKLEEQENQMEEMVTQIGDKIKEEYEEKVRQSLSEKSKLEKQLRVSEALTFKTVECFSNDETKVRFYTGLPSYAVFKVLLDGLTSYFTSLSIVLSKFTLEPWQSLLMTLMKLRLSIPHQDLAFRFGVSKATAVRTFEKWIDAMHDSVYPVMVKWPDRETLWETMPKEFRESYGNSVAVITDYFEIFTDKPSWLETQAEMGSNNMHHHTVKILIGISPTGAITFVSSDWGARASDKHVVQESCLYELPVPHDVMADRGFNVAEHLALYGAKLLIPAFTWGQDQLSSHDVPLTRSIANPRIRLERVIGLVRNKYKILKGVLPVEMLKRRADEDFSQIDKIVHVCCALTNMCPSIVVHPEIHTQMSE